MRGGDGLEGDPLETSSESVEDRLEEWRDAERQAGASEAGTARAKMARKQANHARDVFHEAEDAEREHQGDHRARKTESREANEAEEA